MTGLLVGGEGGEGGAAPKNGKEGKREGAQEIRDKGEGLGENQFGNHLVTTTTTGENHFPITTTPYCSIAVTARVAQ